ncbi:putative methyltransferase-domain-containing protein [Dendryphion nanum]|uniref:Methyltransferase-domain-containing protein n=1 Tax=Dendryphion nanum TaxID=256645 RepID=A0A9P9E7P3_9PLEO|nr:putative methyltransferase-domain-containing protein [Dendryphion nanum]
MRYIRFLKTPRLVAGKDASNPQIHCLITITSDLGDSFLPYDIALVVELRSGKTEEIVTSRSVQWTAGMRDLFIKLPYRKDRASPSLKIRISVDPKSPADDLERLREQDTRGVVSAWSALLDPSSEHKQSEKLIERRISVPGAKPVCIWEETGESIARHLWDAGIVFTSHFHENNIKSGVNLLKSAFSPGDESRRLKVLELGAGCGLFGISIAQSMKHTDVLLTDLPEAKDIISRNLKTAEPKEGTTIEFEELNWDKDLPNNIQTTKFDVLVATDCTYNPDSSPALVNTIQRLGDVSPDVYIIVAMKIRHLSENVFFELMSKAKFEKKESIEIPLPGDDGAGEETVWVHVFAQRKGM